MKENLTDICNSENGDKGTFFCHKDSDVNIAHGYSEIYEKFLEEFRDDEKVMLEIGLWCPFFPGSSVRTWNRYFSKLKYYGIDIVDCTQLSGKNIDISIVDQKSETQLNELINRIPNPDFIIDDGCHHEDAIIISLGTLFPHLKSGGYYFIEDLHVVNLQNILKLKYNSLQSNYISQDKINYINENIEYCDFFLNNKFCVIKKK